MRCRLCSRKGRQSCLVCRCSKGCAGKALEANSGYVSTKLISSGQTTNSNYWSVLDVNTGPDPLANADLLFCAASGGMYSEDAAEDFVAHSF